MEAGGGGEKEREDGREEGEGRRKVGGPRELTDQETCVLRKRSEGSSRWSSSKRTVNCQICAWARNVMGDEMKRVDSSDGTAGLSARYNIAQAQRGEGVK